MWKDAISPMAGAVVSLLVIILSVLVLVDPNTKFNPSGNTFVSILSYPVLSCTILSYPVLLYSHSYSYSYSCSCSCFATIPISLSLPLVIARILTISLLLYTYTYTYTYNLGYSSALDWYTCFLCEHGLFSFVVAAKERV